MNNEQKICKFLVRPIRLALSLRQDTTLPHNTREKPIFVGVVVVVVFALANWVTKQKLKVKSKPSTSSLKRFAKPTTV
jgi:hypothetical protein